MESMLSGADIVRAARVRAGMTQVEFALQARVTQSVISAYESGAREPSFAMLQALVNAAGYDLDVCLHRSTAVHFFGPIGRKVEAKRSRLRAIIEDRGVRNPKVFGSVARNEDRKDSDLDILGEIPAEMSLLALGELESELEGILGAPVEIIPESNLKSLVRGEVLKDLVPL